MKKTLLYISPFAKRTVCCDFFSRFFIKNPTQDSTLTPTELDEFVFDNEVEGEVEEVEEEEMVEGASTVQEGWIMKRGEHFRNWRQR